MPGLPPDVSSAAFASTDSWALAYWRAKDVSPDGFVVLDAVRDRDEKVIDFRYAYVNPSGAEIVLRTPAELIGRSMVEVFPAVRENGILSAYASVADTGTPWQQELLYDRDGISVGFRIVAVRMGEQVALSFADITARVRLERERDAAVARTMRLQALTAALASANSSAEVAEAVVDQIRESLGALHVSILDSDVSEPSIVRFAASQIPGDVRDEVTVMGFDAQWPAVVALRSAEVVVVIDADDMAHRFPTALAVASRLGVEATIAMPLTHHGQTHAVLSVDFAEAHEPTEAELSFLSAIADQCALALERARLADVERKSQHELQRALENLAVTSRAKSRFLAEMSHELRTPLQAMEGYLFLFRAGLLGPVEARQADALDRITIAQHRIVRLANEVLELAQLENGESRMDIGDVLVADAIRAAESMVTPQRIAGEIEFSVIDDATDLSSRTTLVRADPDRLQQILLNLLSNAVKFTSPTGHIDVRVSSSDSTVRIDVIDTGRGIPESHLESIFDPFVQAPTSSDDQRGDKRGVGLGLAISRELARRMDGDLSVTSQVGVGSVFSLRLPAV